LTDWRRNYRAVWVSLFTTSMGLMAFLPVLTLHVGEAFAIDDPDERLWWGGLIYGAAPLTAAILGPVWGALGDRVGKKPMAIRANLAIALTTAFMPLAPSPIALLVLRAVQGAFAGYVAPAMALVTQDAPPEHQGVTIGRLQAAMALGSGLGPIIGGEITLQFGRPALFYVTSVLTALAAVVLWRGAREVRPPAAAAAAPFLREFTVATAQLLRNRVFFVLLLLILLLRLGQNMLEPFVAPFVHELGAPAWMAWFCTTPEQGVERTIGVAFAVLAVAQVLLTPLWGRLADRHGPLRCLAVLAVALGAVLAATVLVATPNQFLLSRSLAACFMAGSMTLAYAAASRRVVTGRRTLAFSLVQSCMQFGFALGPQIGSRAALLGATQHANLRHAFAVAGAMCALSGAGMIVLRRRSAGAVDQQTQPIGGEGI